MLVSAATDMGITWPDDYAAFMSELDGGEGWVGNSYVCLWPAVELAERNRDLHVQELAPGLVLFGSDGGGEGFAFDLGTDPPSIVMVPFVGLDQPIVQGTTLVEFLERMHLGLTFAK